MKICKVTLIKRMNNDICSNIYPVGYNPHNINVVAYDENPLNDGDNVGYCIGLVSDDFSFTGDMVEIQQAAADSFIEARGALIQNTELKDKFVSFRKGIITNAIT